MLIKFLGIDIDEQILLVVDGCIGNDDVEGDTIRFELLGDLPLA